MMSVQDEETQRKGLVEILYGISHGANVGNFMSPIMVSRAKSLMQCLPYRVSAVHVCYDDFRLRPLASIVKTISGKQRRLRFREHFGESQQFSQPQRGLSLKEVILYISFGRSRFPILPFYVGSYLECQYTLMTFGILQTILPLDMDGFALDNTRFYKLLEEQRRFEEQSRVKNEATANSLGRIDVPTRRDVLLGRGRPFQLYAGNRRLAVLINMNKARHDCSWQHGGKGAICDEVIQIVKISGGRFLKRKQDGDGWEEVDHKAARDKVSHGYALFLFLLCLCGTFHLTLFQFLCFMPNADSEIKNLLAAMNSC
jgi:hypothetical protein